MLSAVHPLLILRSISLYWCARVGLSIHMLMASWVFRFWRLQTKLPCHSGTSLCICAFSLGSAPRSRMARLYGRCVFNVLRMCQTLQSIFIPASGEWEFQLLCVFIGRWSLETEPFFKVHGGHLAVVSSHAFLVTSDAENLFTSLFYICVSSLLTFIYVATLGPCCGRRDL